VTCLFVMATRRMDIVLARMDIRRLIRAKLAKRVSSLFASHGHALTGEGPRNGIFSVEAVNQLCYHSIILM